LALGVGGRPCFFRLVAEALAVRAGSNVAE
jgi:hypothetical protein